jgi:hypothetical protein
MDTWFLATWTFPPALQYLENLKISRLHDAPLFFCYMLEYESENPSKQPVRSYCVNDCDVR